MFISFLNYESILLILCVNYVHITNNQLQNNFFQEFALFARKHFALSLLPHDQIIPALAMLAAEIPQLQSARTRRQWKILHRDYFQKYWINQVGTEVISSYGLVHRTNNHCESLHSK